MYTHPVTKPLPGLLRPACLMVALLCVQMQSRAVEHDAAPAQTANELAALLEALDVIRQDAGVAAVGVALVSRETILHTGGLGVESHATRQPVTRHTLFRLGSITKSFVGLTALSMRRDVPDLFERSVNSVIPDLLGAQRGGADVRLPHLLEHTAGLKDLSSREFAFQGERVTFSDAIRVDPETRRLRWPAGAHSSYSNAGYGYAGYFLEQIATRPFEELVHDRVLEPLDMTGAGFFVTDETPVLAAGYDVDGKTPIPYWHMLYRSFGGLNATPVDMSRFIHALLQPEGSGRVFETAAERARFENPSTTLAARTGLSYGYGLGNYHWFSNGVRYHGHGGDADGYLSHYGYSTEAGYGYFVVITAFNKKPLNAMRERIERYLATLARPVQASRSGQEPSAAAAFDLSKERLAELAGGYTQVTQRFGSLPSPGKATLRVVVESGQLHTHRNGRTLPLIAVSDQHFRRPWQPDATYAFVRAGQDVYLQGDIGNFKRLRTPD